MNVENNCKGFKETIFLTKIPNMKEKLIKGKNTPKEECISEDEVSLIMRGINKYVHKT